MKSIVRICNSAEVFKEDALIRIREEMEKRRSKNQNVPGVFFGVTPTRENIKSNL